MKYILFIPFMGILICSCAIALVICLPFYIARAVIKAISQPEIQLNYGEICAAIDAEVLRRGYRCHICKGKKAKENVYERI